MNLRNTPILLVALLVALFLAACDAVRDENKDSDENGNGPAPAASTLATDAVDAAYQTLTIDEFAAIIENQPEEYQIINVHIPYEGEVANTDAHIAYNDLDALLAAIPDKDAPVILYCRSGNMSEQASRALVERGYTNVWDVPGGMAAWQSSGRELIDR